MVMTWKNLHAVFSEATKLIVLVQQPFFSYYFTWCKGYGESFIGYK